MNCNRGLVERNQQNRTFHKSITPNVTKWIPSIKCTDIKHSINNPNNSNNNNNMYITCTSGKKK